MKNKQYTLLLERSAELFKLYGIKDLTMDDVAREMSMSKKTIYRFVENKAQLVKLAVAHYLNNDRRQLEKLLKPSGNAVDEMIQTITYLLSRVGNFKSSAIQDIEKYYPEAWEVYLQYRYHFLLNHIADNLKSGIRQGLYRSELDPDIVSKIYTSGIDMLANQKLFPATKYVYVTIYRQFVNYHLRGVVTPKGLKYLEEHNFFKDNTTS